MSDLPAAMQAAARALTAVAERRCPLCEAPVERERQVGRCVYVDPCGHRSHIGTARDENAKRASTGGPTRGGCETGGVRPDRGATGAAHVTAQTEALNTGERGAGADRPAAESAAEQRAGEGDSTNTLAAPGLLLEGDAGPGAALSLRDECDGARLRPERHPARRPLAGVGCKGQAGDPSPRDTDSSRGGPVETDTAVALIPEIRQEAPHQPERVGAGGQPETRDVATTRAAGGAHNEGPVDGEAVAQLHGAAPHAASAGTALATAVPAALDGGASGRSNIRGGRGAGVETRAASFEPGVYPGLSFAEYRAIPAINVSSLHGYERSPLHARHLAHNDHSTAERALGTALHAAVLEPAVYARVYNGRERVRGKGKVAINARRRAEDDAEGLIRLDRKDRTRIEGMRDAVLAHPIAGPLIETALATELTIVWRELETSALCKERVDILGEHEGRTICADLKTCRDARWFRFRKDVIDYRYFVAADFYVSGLAERDQAATFWWIAVESEPPHGIAIHIPSDELLLAGNREWRAAVKTHLDCRRDGVWPGYPTEPQTLNAPDWLRGRER